MESDVNHRPVGIFGKIRWTNPRDAFSDFCQEAPMSTRLQNTSPIRLIKAYIVVVIVGQLGKYGEQSLLDGKRRIGPYRR